MKELEGLIKMGFTFKLADGKVTFEHRGRNPPVKDLLKPLLQAVRQNKEIAERFIQSIVEYEIPKSENFDCEVQECLQEAHSKNIVWLRTDVYTKARKVVLVGMIKNNEMCIS